mmetsp:Transcript_4686/g.11637  ORF Transcript_4686/g.11637 Transcript_4686/m.11637 type:complete len:210 (+) Transcript_4686:1242-1871(+)
MHRPLPIRIAIAQSRPKATMLSHMVLVMLRLLRHERKASTMSLHIVVVLLPWMRMIRRVLRRPRSVLRPAVVSWYARTVHQPPYKSTLDHTPHAHHLVSTHRPRHGVSRRVVRLSHRHPAWLHHRLSPCRPLRADRRACTTCHRQSPTALFPSRQQTTFHLHRRRHAKKTNCRHRRRLVPPQPRHLSRSTHAPTTTHHCHRPRPRTTTE